MSAIKGWEGSIRIGTTKTLAEDTGTDVPDVQSVSPAHGNNAEALYQLGSRSPTEVKEGNIDLSLGLTLHYTGGTTFSGYAGVGASGALTKYYVGLYPRGYTGGYPEIRLYGVFNDWSLDVDQEGVLVETLSFIGELIAVGTAPIG